MVAPEQGMTDTLILMNEHSALRAMRAWMRTAYATTSRSSFKCKCNLLHLRPRASELAERNYAFAPPATSGNRCSTKSPISVRLQ
jgi:hypothetical protein